METKRCAFCREIKELSEFSYGSKQLDGHQSYCKVCQHIYDKYHNGYGYTAHEIKEKIRTGEISVENEFPTITRNRAQSTLIEPREEAVEAPAQSVNIGAELLKMEVFPNAVSIITTDTAMIVKYEDKEALANDLPKFLRLDKQINIDGVEVLVM